MQHPARSVAGGRWVTAQKRRVGKVCVSVVDGVPFAYSRSNIAARVRAGRPARQYLWGPPHYRQVVMIEKSKFTRGSSQKF